MVYDISGVILAGGANKRFGGITKSKAVVGGESIISRITGTIQEFFCELIIITNNPSEFSEFTQCKILGDQLLNAGPLGGIHAGLKSSSGSAVFIFAGDMPFLDKGIIKDQLDEFTRKDYDVLIPKIGQLIEPLHAIYRKSVLKDLEKFISEGKSKAVRDFLTRLNTGCFEVPGTDRNKQAFTNINSPSDIADLAPVAVCKPIRGASSAASV
jgi:molybdopterin-guanine dinucleotide biosynthesis protein A